MTISFVNALPLLLLLNHNNGARQHRMIYCLLNEWVVCIQRFIVSEDFHSFTCLQCVTSYIALEWKFPHHEYESKSQFFSSEIKDHVSRTHDTLILSMLYISSHEREVKDEKYLRSAQMSNLEWSEYVFKIVNIWFLLLELLLLSHTDLAWLGSSTWYDIN